MQIKDLLVHFSLVVSISLASMSIAQDDYQIPDLTPSRVQIDRPAEHNPTVATPTRLPASTAHPAQSAVQQPIVPGNNITDNGLRGNTTDKPAGMTPIQPTTVGTSALDDQSRPPQPPSGASTPAQAGPPLVPTGVDPLRELDPDRLVPPSDSRTAPARQQDHPGLAPPSSRMEPVSPMQSSASQATITPRIPATISDQPSTIAKASFEDRGTQVNAGDRNRVEQLLQAYDVSSAREPLPGKPVTLDELLRTTPIPARLNMLQQYWGTYFDWATLQNRRSWETWLRQLPRAQNGPQQLILQAARSMAADEVLAAEIQLAQSQSRLHQLAASRDDLLPLPLNEPLTGSYITHYDWYASRKVMPAKLKGINEMLPRNYTLIAQRASTVEQAVAAQNQAKNAFGAGQIAVGDLLEAGRNWQTSLQGFVSSVVRYNQAISEYALTITSPQQPVDQIVSMLVAKPKPATSVAQANSILERPASSIDLNRSGVRTTQPTTSFPEGSNRNGFPVQPSSSQPALSSNPNRAATGNRQPILPPTSFQPPATVPGPTTPASAQPGGTFTPAAGQPTSVPIQSQPASGNRGPTQPGNSNQFNGGGSFGGG